MNGNNIKLKIHNYIMGNEKSKYTTIKLPTDLVLEYVDSLLDVKKFGFSSRTEVVKIAVRDHYEKMKGEMKNKKFVFVEDINKNK